MFKTSLFTSFITLSLSYEALAAVVSETLTISNVNISPDGFTRSAVVANGQFPGPLISGNIGDNLQITVADDLTDTTMRRATSVHWHGLFQASTTEMDGPAWVNQCPIIPGNSFLYNFNVPGQSGTYWYHSHLSTQYCDGLRGPLVLYDPNDPLADMYDIDDETTVITLADWYHSVAPSLFPNTGDVDPTPDSTTINGLGRYSGGSTDSALAVVNVTSGQRYRFRIVSASCYPSFTFSIDGHNMTIIEADGVETEPVTVDSLVIYAAQRYSVVVTADQAVDNYWIRADPSVGTTGFANGINSAILRYTGADNVDPSTNQTTDGTVLNEADLSPLVDPGAPGDAVAGGVDYALNMVIGLNATSGMHTVNGVSWASPNVPVLLQILSGTTNPADILPAGSIYSLPGNSTIEISLPGGFPHPIHLHGHNIDVVRVAGSTVYNYANPVRRDTVSIGGASDNVTFRFTTNNAGPWFMHCHIDWHLEAGLAVVFTEGIDNIEGSNPVDTAWSDLCPEYASDDPDTAFE
ncbi:hypothetical protein EW145_g227 [Phellinidium pouzarii]|uniref:Laccase n=1 Tax=Phellinidium pouzarii TaxID=167371 RepID=A0A4S4LJU5_9AGAM|nr:hypothetical protein EW145_g227 [Phellinidium pouzarii]